MRSSIREGKEHQKFLFCFVFFSSRATKQLLLNINELHMYLFKEVMQKVLTTSLNSIINVSVKNRCSALEMLPGSIEIMMKP